MKRRRFDARGFVSILLFLNLLILAITGVGLFVAPSGRVARDTGFSFLGMSKEVLESVHTTFGFMMVVLVVFHLLFNWNILVNYVYRLTKGVRKLRFRESMVALLITVFFLLSSIYDFPPVSTLNGLGERLSDVISRVGSSNTTGDIEEESHYVRGYMTIKEAASTLGVPLEIALERLEDAGIEASPDTTVREIMDEYHVNSEDISNIMLGQEVGS